VSELRKFGEIEIGGFRSKTVIEKISEKEVKKSNLLKEKV